MKGDNQISGLTWIARKVDCTQEHNLFISTKHYQMMHGFIKGVSVDVLYL